MQLRIHSILHGGWERLQGTAGFTVKLGSLTSETLADGSCSDRGPCEVNQANDAGMSCEALLDWDAPLLSLRGLCLCWYELTGAVLDPGQIYSMVHVFGGVL